MILPGDGARERASLPLDGAAGPDPLPPFARSPDPSPGELVRFAATAPAHPAMKAREVRSRFGFGITRYHQLLRRAVADPAVMIADPVAVGQIRRQIEAGRARRRVGHLREIGPIA